MPLSDAPQFLTDAYWPAHDRVEAELSAQGVDELDAGAEAFFAGLRAVEAAVRADTLQEFAETLRERYPEDVFPKPNDENYHALNVALARANITLDRFSADLMRRAAAQADAEAAAIRAQQNGDSNAE